jgi:RHS repeat-associated protein
MAGISSKALNGASPNRYKFNSGNELQSGEFFDDSGLELFDAVNRSYDPQLGRFWQVDELGEVNEESTPYIYALNNPILLNDPLGLKEGPNDIKTLPEVVVTAKRKLSHNQMQAVYWQMLDNGIDFSRVKSEVLRERLVRWDRTQHFLDRLHAMNRQQDEFVLEVGSWFVPIGWAVKAVKLRRLIGLFNLKRGKAVIKLAEESAEQVAIHGDEAQKLLNPGIDVTESGLKHAIDRHTVNGIEKFAGKSKFNNADEVLDLVQQSTQMPMVKQAYGNFARVVDAGRSIGFDKVTQQQTSIYTVITNAEGKLVTAFPGKPVKW